MPNLKVKPLEWYMDTDAEELEDMGYTASEPIVGRDGYYCRGNVVWFEVNGQAYTAYPKSTRQRAREYFCYEFSVNDEAILTDREVAAAESLLAITRDSAVRRMLRQRLNLHKTAKDARESVRRSKRAMMRIGQGANI